MSKRYRGSRGENQDYIRDLKKRNTSLERENKRLRKENLRLQPTQDEEEEAETKVVQKTESLLKCENEKCHYFNIPSPKVTIITFSLPTGDKSYKVCVECGSRRPHKKK